MWCGMHAHSRPFPPVNHPRVHQNPPDVANSFVDSFTNPEGQQTTCNDISPALAEVVGGGERFTIEDFYTAYLGGDFSVQWQVARACAIGFVALGFVKVVIAISKMCGCRFGGLAIWTTQLLQFAAGGVAFAAGGRRHGRPIPHRKRRTS